MLPFLLINQIILKSIYIRRIAADLGIDHIWVRSKTVVMDTKMSETVFNIIKEGMTSDSLQSSLTFNEGLIEVSVGRIYTFLIFNCT